MALIFITGISTAGKSALAKELVSRGYEAYDTEHNGISAWFDRQTGERVAELGEMPERTAEWLNRHKWLISADWVSGIASKAKNKHIFLCGGSANEPEIRKMCDKVIWLKTDEDTIRQRITNDRDHDYGTKPHELASIIESNNRKEQEYIDFGALIVDARQPLGKVVDKILSKCRFLD
jgi:shikimate kinase